MKSNKEIHKHKLAVSMYIALEFFAPNDDVRSLGVKLQSLGFDDSFNGGFWIIDMSNGFEFYSNKFLNSLEFEGEHDFPFIMDSWQKYIDPKDLIEANKQYELHKDTDGKEPYNLDVWYTTKFGNRLNVNCSGTLLRDVGNRKSPRIMIGTHIIL